MARIGTPILKAFVKNKGFGACGDPRFLLNRLIEHGLAGRAFNAPDLPLALKTRCEAQHLQQKHLNLIYLELLSAICREAKKRGIKVTVLKGAALLGTLYRDIGERSMADLDLLIEPESASSWDGLLLDLGLSLKVEKRWAANRFKRNYIAQRNGAPVVVELHTRLFYDQSEAWDTEERGEFHVLRQEEEFLYLVGHLAYQHTFLKLSWLVDLYLWWQMHGNTLDIDRLLRLAITHRKESSLFMVMKILSELLENPDLATYCVIPDWKRSLLEACVTDTFLISPFGSRPQYLAVKHLLKDSVFEALRYDWGWVMQRTGISRQLG